LLFDRVLGIEDTGIIYKLVQIKLSEAYIESAENAKFGRLRATVAQNFTRPDLGIPKTAVRIGRVPAGRLQR
jgi:hypothetical protein